jgi:cytidylate kinase
MTLSKRVDAIVSHQLARWQVGPHPSRPLPCVALSRMPGSGGAEIGHRVAERLHYGFFGSEIVDQIAAERGISRDLLRGLDEHVRTGIERFVADTFRERNFTESDYLRDVARIVTTLGRRGGAVILGRGAAFLLPPDQALRVLLVAPRAARIERVGKERGITRDEAAAWVDREDAWREHFVRHHFALRQDDPTLCDVVLNTTTLGVETAVETVLHLMRERFGIHVPLG